MAKPVLYGGSLSPFVRKVMWVLAIKGIEYDHVQVNPFEKTPEMLAKSPLGKIPYFDTESGYSIADSVAIVQYLEEKYPGNSVLPEDLEIRSKARFLELYVGSKMGPEIIFPLFGQKLVRRYLLKQEVDTQVVEQGLENTKGIFEFLEKTLGDSPYFLGDKLNLADISVATALGNLYYVNVEVGEEYGKLHSWWQRCKENEQLSAFMKSDMAMIEKIKSR